MSDNKIYTDSWDYLLAEGLQVEIINWASHTSHLVPFHLMYLYGSEQKKVKYIINLQRACTRNAYENAWNILL